MDSLGFGLFFWSLRHYTAFRTTSLWFLSVPPIQKKIYLSFFELQVGLDFFQKSYTLRPPDAPINLGSSIA